MDILKMLLLILLMAMGGCTYTPKLPTGYDSFLSSRVMRTENLEIHEALLRFNRSHVGPKLTLVVTDMIYSVPAEKDMPVDVTSNLLVAADGLSSIRIVPHHLLSLVKEIDEKNTYILYGTINSLGLRRRFSGVNAGPSFTARHKESRLEGDSGIEGGSYEGRIGGNLIATRGGYTVATSRATADFGSLSSSTFVGLTYDGSGFGFTSTF